MSAIEALKAARAAGIELKIDGDDLLLEASAPPPGNVIDLVSCHKAELVALLRPAEDPWLRGLSGRFRSSSAALRSYLGCVGLNSIRKLATVG